MRLNTLPWLAALALALGTFAAAAQDDGVYGNGNDDGINWFGDDRSGSGQWEYDSDLIGDDEWEQEGDDSLANDDSGWGNDNYGSYDNDYNWGTDDEGFDSWYGDSDAAFGDGAFGFDRDGRGSLAAGEFFVQRRRHRP